MKTMEELQEIYEEKYGENWDRAYLTEEEHIAWIEACYDFYENHGTKKETFGGPYSDRSEFIGYPFEILHPISPLDNAYDPIALPMWMIRVDGEWDDAVFAAYPEELFEE